MLLFLAGRIPSVEPRLGRSGRTSFVAKDPLTRNSGKQKGQIWQHELLGEGFHAERSLAVVDNVDAPQILEIN